MSAQPDERMPTRVRIENERVVRAVKHGEPTNGPWERTHADAIRRYAREVHYAARSLRNNLDAFGALLGRPDFTDEHRRTADGILTWAEGVLRDLNVEALPPPARVIPLGQARRKRRMR